MLSQRLQCFLIGRGRFIPEIFYFKKLYESVLLSLALCVNRFTLIAGAAYIRVFILYYHIKYHILNIMVKIKCDINQQDLKRNDFLFVKCE